MSVTLLLSLVLAAPPAPATLPLGFLWSKDDRVCTQYTPQEGDVFLISSKYIKFSILYAFARSSHPWHSAIVIRRRSGELEVLESGGSGCRSATLRSLEERMTQELRSHFDDHGMIWVRARTSPLTPEESEKLTSFAEQTVGKRFTNGFELAKLFLPRPLLPETRPEQTTWFCSEVVTVAIRQCDLLRGQEFRKSINLLPRDLFFDHGIDMSTYYSPPLRWSIVQTNPGRGPLFLPK